MGFVNTGSDMLFQIGNITPESFSATNTQGKDVKQFVDEFAHNNGLREAVTIGGTSLGLVGAASAGLTSATASSTAAAGGSILTSVSTALSGVGTSLTATLSTAGTALSTVALPAVICGIAAAGGGYIGFKAGEKFVEDHFDEIDAIVKKFSLADNEVACWTDGDKTYVPDELVDEIMQVMTRNGYFAESGIGTPQAGTYSDYTQINRVTGMSGIISSLLIAYRNSSYYNNWNELVNHILNDSTLPADLGGIIALYSYTYPGAVDGVQHRIILRSYSTDMLKGNIPPVSTNSTQIEACTEITKTWELYKSNTSTSLDRFTEDEYSTELEAGSNLYYLGGSLSEIQNLFSFQNVAEVFTKDPSATLPTTGNPAIDYPDWAANKTRVSTRVKDDGTVEDINAYPMVVDVSSAIDGTQARSWVGDLTDAIADAVAKAIADTATDADTAPKLPNPPIGHIPDIDPPTSMALSGVVKIYSPTNAQLVDFSQWLWSTNLWTNVSKLIANDPMQAILGLNLLYATPSFASSNSDIVVGNLNSQIESRVVDEQYININCGTVHIKHYYGNVLDYSNVRVQLYLPFVGIVPLSVRDVMGRDVRVTARIDVLTGTVLYKVKVIYDNGAKIHPLYTFEGNCAVQIPLTASNYNGIFSTVASIAGSAITGIATKGVVGGVVGGVGSAAVNLASGGFQSQIQRSSGIGSNAGAMGYKKPYLIIEREIPYNARVFNKFSGYPSNVTVKLGNLNGYTRVKDIRMNKVQCTQAERDMIEQQLKGGVIL